MPGDHSDIVRFFNACYQADNRELTLWDVFSAKHEYLKILTSSEFEAQHRENHLEIFGSYAEKLNYSVTTYRREKTLHAGFCFVSGRIKGLSAFSKTSKRICAPLVLAEATLSKLDGKISVVVDPLEYRWNTNLLSQLLADKDAFHDLDSDFNLDTGVLPDLNDLGEWIKVRESENKIRTVDDSIIDESALKKASQRRKDSGLLLSGGAMLLLSKRSRTSRGIIDELEQIAMSDEISAPLKELCDKEKIIVKHGMVCRPENVPGILSFAQKKALENVVTETLSQLIGPPGTGKSYTIACMALERFLAGESILIVSENEHAVDVLQEKLVEQLGVSANAIVRAGNKNYHKQLVSTIENLTQGLGIEKPGELVDTALKKNRKEIQIKEKLFTEISRKAVEDGIYLDSVLSKRVGGIIAGFKTWFLKKRTKKFGFLHDQLKQIQVAYRERDTLIAQKINYQYNLGVLNTLSDHRSEFVSFLHGLKAKTSSKQEKMFAEIDYSILLRTMPIWLCSMSALSKALPLKKELFDLVIIDEATQCDISSAIPAVFRAKRAVVVGDPKQLRHVSFLSGKKQEEIRRKLGLNTIKGQIDYREHSMIDFADQAISSQSAVTMLDEHYRSLPEIIRFSNQTFYNNSLRIMTEKPLQGTSTPVEVIMVKDGIRQNGVNLIEAESLFKKLKVIVDSQKDIPEQHKASIGILSFFRDQAEALQKDLLAKFSLEDISVHKLRAGTPYAFQGEERDIMLISCAVSSDEKAGTWNYLNRSDVFNVAMTRARYSQCLFLSVPEMKVPETSLLKAYLKLMHHQREKLPINISDRDKNIGLLAKELNTKGFNVFRNFPVAGIPMDLVVTFEGAALAIDVIGFPGEYQGVFPLDRYKIFERAGMQIFPLSYTAYIYNHAEVLDTVSETMKLLSRENKSLLISTETISSNWHKLLEVNPNLAKKVRSLERSLSLLGLEKAGIQVGKLVERYQKFIRLIDEKLNPSELTYSKYASAAEQVLLSGLSNLSSVVVLKQSLPENGEAIEDNESPQVLKQRKEIERILASNEKAIQKLEEITLEWSRINTGSKENANSFDFSLSEIERLIDNVKNYQL